MRSTTGETQVEKALYLSLADEILRIKVIFDKEKIIPGQGNTNKNDHRIHHNFIDEGIKMSEFHDIRKII
jgi:hypothetical protein